MVEIEPRWTAGVATRRSEPDLPLGGGVRTTIVPPPPKPRDLRGDVRIVGAMKLASIRLVTREVDSLVAFYKQVTGIEPFSPPGFKGYAEIRLPSCTIAIVSEEAVAQFNAGAASAAANRSVILEFDVDDVDAEKSRMGSIITDWVQQPTAQPWGTAPCSSAIPTAT